MPLHLAHRCERLWRLGRCCSQEHRLYRHSVRSTDQVGDHQAPPEQGTKAEEWAQHDPYYPAPQQDVEPRLVHKPVGVDHRSNPGHKLDDDAAKDGDAA